jgi:hypothetical protein
MLASIIDAVKGEVVSHLTQKTGMGTNQAEQAVPLAKDSISEGLSSAMAGGNIGGILDMIRGASGGGEAGLAQNMVYKGIAAKFINKLTSKLGIPESMARTASSVALPYIMNAIAGKTAEDGDSDDIDQGSLMNVLGLDGGSLLNKAGGMLGGFLK